MRHILAPTRNTPAAILTRHGSVQALFGSATKTHPTRQPVPASGTTPPTPAIARLHQCERPHWRPRAPSGGACLRIRPRSHTLIRTRKPGDATAQAPPDPPRRRGTALDAPRSLRAAATPRLLARASRAALRSSAQCVRRAAATDAHAQRRTMPSRTRNAHAHNAKSCAAFITLILTSLTAAPKPTATLLHRYALKIVLNHAAHFAPARACHEICYARTGCSVAALCRIGARSAPTRAANPVLRWRPPRSGRSAP